MKSVSNQELQTAFNTKDYIKLAKSIFKKYQSFRLNSDEKKQILLDALWYALATWDESKSIFTTYLYNNIRYKTLLYIKKNRNLKEQTNKNLGRVFAKEKVLNSDFDNLIAGLHENIKLPIIQKFVYGMSATEIGLENGYNKDYANKLIQRGVKLLRKSFNERV